MTSVKTKTFKVKHTHMKKFYSRIGKISKAYMKKYNKLEEYPLSNYAKSITIMWY